MKKKQIVVLDRATIPKRFNLTRPEHPHHWLEYSLTDTEDVIDRCKDASVIVTNKVVIDRPVLSECHRLEHIAVAATGVNIVDLTACQELGITVSNVPNYASDSVAEHALTCALNLRRNLIRYRSHVIDNEWQNSDSFCLYNEPIVDLSESTIGIIGFGNIGRKTAHLAAALGMQVIVHSHSQKSEAFRNVELDDLLSSADVISVHCSLTPDTTNLISAPQFEMMKPSALLINTARGGIVNEHDLVIAIRAGKIAGVALDVLNEEPPTKNATVLSIADMDNVIITPHIAWASDQALHSFVSILSQNIAAALADAPQNLVT